jgi:RNA polymerase sigma-70 factor (ECF subfamily)
VVVLRDVYDLPHEAIAAELGITETAAKVRLHRARKKLRVRLFPLHDEVGGAGEGDEEVRGAG